MTATHDDAPSHRRPWRMLGFLGGRPRAPPPPPPLPPCVPRPSTSRRESTESVATNVDIDAAAASKRRSARQFSRNAAFSAAGALVRHVSSSARASLSERLAARRRSSSSGGGDGRRWTASPRSSTDRDARRRAGLEAVFASAPTPLCDVADAPAEKADFLPPELLARSQALHAASDRKA